MQNKLTRQKYIMKVMDDLTCLGPSDFEQLSYLVGEHILKKTLQKRGATVIGHPVGYTLDAYSDNISECIESSVDKDYFEDFSVSDNGSKSKVEQDILHVFCKSKAPKCIILFSNQICKPSQATNLCNYISIMEKVKNVKISWYDGRKLSEYIIDNMLEDNLFIQRLRNFVPVLDEILMMSINNINIPSLPNNYVCYDNLELLKENLYNNRCLYIHGISGIGKSLLSIELAKAIQSDFDSLFYVDGTKINSATDLQATELFGTTGKINLVGNLKRPGTLVIIDDLKSDYDKIANELINNCSVGSCVIVTSQTAVKNETICFGLEFPSEERSKCMLEFNTGVCPQEIISIIKDKTNFHPLLLSLINQMVQELNEWNFVKDELKHCPNFEMDSGVTVCEYLLRHYLPILKKEFDVINWLNCKYINKDLLKKIIGFSGFEKLKKRALIYETSNCSLKVHDIIFRCIKSVSDQQSNYETEFLDFFKDLFLVKNASYYQAIHLHQEKILEIIRCEMTPGITLYLYLDIWSNDAHKLISNISIDKYVAETYVYDKKDLYALYSVVQLIECSYKIYKAKWEERKEFAKRQIVIFQKLITLRNVPKEFIVYAKHHLGKLYVFIGDDTAVGIFKELIGQNSKLYESKLQLAKLLMKKENTKREGEDMLCGIIEAYMAGDSPSMAIVLATYQELKNTKNEKLIKYFFVDKFDEFAKLLQVMALEQFDQPYRVLSNVSRVYTYRYPKLLRELVKSIPFPSTEEIGDKYAFAIAETYKECGKSILWDSCDSKEEADVYFEQAEIFYSILEGKTDAYKLIKHAENLNKLKEYNKAVALLSDDKVFFDAKNKPFREHRYAEALYGLGSEYYAQALKHINKAIESENIGEYVAAFNELKGDILFGINPTEQTWKKCFELALEYADTEKYKDALLKKYHSYLNEKK